MCVDRRNGSRYSIKTTHAWVSRVCTDESIEKSSKAEEGAKELSERTTRWGSTVDCAAGWWGMIAAQKWGTTRNRAGSGGSCVSNSARVVSFPLVCVRITRRPTDGFLRAARNLVSFFFFCAAIHARPRREASRREP